ncbi:MAG: TlpA disulfide reductase family protein, partial [Pirellulales bacterium]
ELLMAAQSLQVNQSTMAEKLQSIFAMKLSAAKTLAEVATAQDEKEVAVYAKIEALSHLAGIGDTNAAKELEEYATEISKIENPKMAHQAKLVLLSFRVGEYDSGVLKSPDEILKEIEAFLADKTLLTQTDFRMMIQILNAFQKQGHTDAINVAKEKIGNAFVEHQNTRLAMDAWMLRADGSKVIDALRESVEQIAKNPSDASLAEGFKKVIADLQTAYPEPTTLLMLANYVINLESIGALASAQTITESLKSQLDKIKDERQRQEIDRILQDAEKHFAFLGKPLDLSKLVTLDGKPLDTASLKNKVVLVDFWATWCQPCLASFPELKTLYEKHKDKGFEIVGVNIDEELASVQEFMKKDALPWTVVRSVDANAPDAVGFKAPFATEIGVNAIPMVLIVDREGKTVAINLRENAFVEKIESLIATP